MEVGHSGVEAQEFLSAFPPFEPLLLSFLSSCGSVFLLNDIVSSGRGDHLLVVNVSQARDLPNRGTVASELIGMNNVWNVIFNQ